LYGIARALGITGDTVRGLLVGLIGFYFMTSAVSDDPTKVKGLDQPLQALVHKPFGVWLLSFAATGPVFPSVVAPCWERSVLTSSREHTISD
jgi:hypothetical protein